MSKIFIVEDEKTIRDELSIFLSRYGYEVEALEDFENIIENIKGSNCDLILLDINLPVFDGYYICRAVRKFSDVPKQPVLLPHKIPPAIWLPPLPQGRQTKQ